MSIKRNTIQRTIVLDTVTTLKSHATADEVYTEITKTHPSISRGTIYRNLNLLAKDGTIKKVEVPNGADCFDHRSFNHYHTKCSICGKVFDVEMDFIDDLQKWIKNTHGFEFDSHTIMFTGICPMCKTPN